MGPESGTVVLTCNRCGEEHFVPPGDTAKSITDETAITCGVCKYTDVHRTRILNWPPRKARLPLKTKWKAFATWTVLDWVGAWIASNWGTLVEGWILGIWVVSIILWAGVAIFRMVDQGLTVAISKPTLAQLQGQSLKHWGRYLTQEEVAEWYENYRRDQSQVRIIGAGLAAGAFLLHHDDLRR